MARNSTDTDLKVMGTYYIIFITVDLLAAMVGFMMGPAGGLAASVLVAAAALRAIAN